MSVRDALAALFGRNEGVHHVEWLGPTFRSMILGLTPEELYRTQPHLRIVLSFVARNIAHLGLKSYARKSDSDRERLRDDPLAMLMARPNASMTQFELLETLASDLGLYDIAYWFVAVDEKAPSGWSIQPIPPSWVVEQRGGTFFAPGQFIIQNPDGRRTVIDAEDMLVFHGWNPGKPKHGTSPVETLKDILAEQVQAWTYRQQIWQRGGRVGNVITRPAGVGWSDAARERFATDWKARWTGPDGAKAGGTPILEDGMTINRLGFAAREEEWAEVAKIAMSTVAAVYHVNPVMVGVLDNANFSNTKEFRKMLYSETLGPQLARIEDRINAFLVPRVAKTEGAYVEFNIEEKLQGDFEEQAAILSTSAGAPWMTRNEVRALRNLPAIVGGDELVVPLNVLSGGQASPRDSGTQNEKSLRVMELKQLPAGRSFRAKAFGDKNDEVVIENVLSSFFKHQREAVLARINGAKDATWWNSESWDKKLSDNLLKASYAVTQSVAARVLDRLGFDEDAYDADLTIPFLRAVADSRAGAINSTTQKQLEAILDGDGPEGVDAAHVFDVIEQSRMSQIAGTLATTYAAFATVETAKQTGAAQKSWIVTSGNPRPEHAAMDGETVGLDDNFSNGAKYPGDPVLGADGVAGCTCDVEVTFG